MKLTRSPLNPSLPATCLGKAQYLGMALYLAMAQCACTAGAGAGAGGSGGTSSADTDQGTSALTTGDVTTATSGSSMTTGSSGFDLTTGAMTTAETTSDPVEEKPEAMLVETLPPDFIAAEKAGGYKIVGALEDLEDLETSNSCVNILRVVVRDFLQSHIDFGERKPAVFENDGLYLGHLLPDLDPMVRKPNVNPSRMPLDLIESFDDWYKNVPVVNKPYVMDIWLQPAGNGLFVFDTTLFFPLETPWNTFSAGDEQSSTRGLRNFLFTTEIHTAFEYKGTEVFNFRGDDDVWVYINNKLAVDIGGIHGPEIGNVALAERATEFGLVAGEVYKLDMFQAERNPTGSNFRIETSLDFKECGVLQEDIIR